jgi:hydrogenase nickel incorporation protein HypA/HybF
MLSMSPRIVHELSLSYALVDSVLDSLSHLRVRRVESVHLIIGELSGVAVEAFCFSFPIAAAGTLLESAELKIEIDPVSVYCQACGQTGRLACLQRFCCPSCGAATADLRSGQQCLIQSIEADIDEEEDEHEHQNCRTAQESS